MIRIRVFEAQSSWVVDETSTSGKKQIAPMEKFIHLVGYDNIKQILSSSPNSDTICYTIFYEDNQPFTPYVEPPKKGIFG